MWSFSYYSKLPECDLLHSVQVFCSDSGGRRINRKKKTRALMVVVVTLNFIVPQQLIQLFAHAYIERL